MLFVPVTLRSNYQCIAMWNTVQKKSVAHVIIGLFTHLCLTQNSHIDLLSQQFWSCCCCQCRHHYYTSYVNCFDLVSAYSLLGRFQWSIHFNQTCRIYTASKYANKTIMMVFRPNALSDQFRWCFDRHNRLQKRTLGLRSHLTSSECSL